MVMISNTRQFILEHAFVLVKFIVLFVLLFHSLPGYASSCVITSKSPSGFEIFPNYPKKGSVFFTIKPDKVIKKDSIIKLGVPFPVNAVSDLEQIKFLKDGVELASSVKQTLKWREFDTSCESVRSIQAYIKVDSMISEPQVIEVKWGEKRAHNLNYGSSEAVFVYATFPAGYLGDCIIRTRTVPVGANDNDKFWKKYDSFYLGYSRTAITHFDLTKYAAWQLERDSAIWNVYFRTGELIWLKEAIRNTKNYASNIRSGAEPRIDGTFILRDPEVNQNWYNKKYSYGQGVLNLYMLTGDDSYLPKILSVSNLVGRIKTNYEPGKFFTERNAAYALLGALNAWELTGQEKYKTRSKKIVADLRRMQKNPPEGWAPIGAPLHRVGDHESCKKVEFPASSPWMGALLAEAIWRYYIFSGDTEALAYLSDYGDFVVNFGLYTIDKGKSGFHGFKAPHYLASNVFKSSVGNSCKNGSASAYHNGDIEHAPDVLGLLIRSRFAKRLLGIQTAEITKSIDELKKSTLALFKFWNRAKFKPVYRVTPPRKYNWWFQAHSDIAFMD